MEKGKVESPCKKRTERTVPLLRDFYYPRIAPLRGVLEDNIRFDNVIVEPSTTATSVPEPSTVLLLTTGLLGYGWHMRRKQAALTRFPVPSLPSP